MKNIFSQIKRYSEQQFVEGQSFKIVLQSTNIPLERANSRQNDVKMQKGNKYTITVKKYMTEHSTSTFDFMKKFNNDIPMPLVTMTGEILDETRGMYKMALKGKAQKTVTCMRCGRHLTNPISMLYGIGPECSSKVGIQISLDEAQERLNELEEYVNNITWTGWVIKSSIKSLEEVE